LNDWQESSFREWNSETKNYQEQEKKVFFEEISESVISENEIILKGFTPDSVWVEWTFTQTKISVLYAEKAFLYEQEKVKI